MSVVDSRSGPLHRLKIARGHLDKVISMLSQGEYCIDILTQSQAVQAQLREVDVLVLERHLSHCVADAMSRGKKTQAVGEVVKVFRRSHA